MGLTLRKKKALTILAPVFVFTILAIIVTFALKGSQRRIASNHLGEGFFAADFPVDERFKEEIKLLREKKRISPANEIAIYQNITLASQHMGIPLGLFWCLLFQESRLNHLAGIHEDRGAYGLGQFSYFSFYEINNHTDKYNKKTKKYLIDLLGQDVRPIE